MLNVALRYNRLQQKTKKERQRWWRSLTVDEQFEYIESIMTKKAIKRRVETTQMMKKYGDKFSCVTCFHRTTGSCIDDMPNGCQYYYNPVTGLDGIAYWCVADGSERVGG